MGSRELERDREDSGRGAGCLEGPAWSTSMSFPCCQLNDWVEGRLIRFASEKRGDSTPTEDLRPLKIASFSAEKRYIVILPSTRTEYMTSGKLERRGKRKKILVLARCM